MDASGVLRWQWPGVRGVEAVEKADGGGEGGREPWKLIERGCEFCMC